LKNKLKIFSGRANPTLASNIVSILDQDLGEISIKTFSDGEIWIKYQENVRGCDVFLIQPTNGPSENIIELALMIDAAVRASAETVTVVIPYFGYGRQDRKDQPRVPISSRVIVDILSAMGANRIITLDLHSTQIQGFAKIPFDNLYSRKILYKVIKNKNFTPEKTVVLAPDIGSVKMSQSYAKTLGMHFALIEKRRFAPNQAEVNHLIGNLDGLDVLIIDDMIDTAGTTVSAADAAMDKGANSVTVVATHGVLSGPAIQRLNESFIRKVIVTDTISIPKKKQIEKLETVSVAGLFAEAISRVHGGESVSALFEF
tara:strand:- start:256 stop:1200 length:945 start_codon:yes stop_codon:yes gene_type:complete